MSLNPQASKQTNGMIRLTWTPDLTVFGYRFYRDGVAVAKGTRPEQASTTFKAETDGKSHWYGIGRALEQATESVEFPEVTPPPPAAGAFMSYPASSAISLSGVTGRVIEKLSFKQTPAGKSAIVLNDCHDIIIRACDFKDVPGCVYAVNCSNIVLDGLRYENITGPSRRTGANVGNLVQFNGVRGGAVKNCKGRGGDTEDIVSIYASHNIDVDDNHLEGTNWTSGSGSGIALCDQGGSNNRARRNILVNPGQVGAFIAGGSGSEISDNIIIGVQRPSSNVGVYVWAQGGGACSGHTVARNTVSWRKADGSNAGYWNAGNCGPVNGEASNTFAASLDPNAYRVVL